MNGSYIALAGSKATSARAIPALVLALTSGLAAAHPDCNVIAQAHAQAWRGHTALQTIGTVKYSTAAVTTFVPKTELGRTLHELRKKILQAGHARPAAALLAELREQRGEA